MWFIHLLKREQTNEMESKEILNDSDVESLEPGDLIEFDRTYYDHWGVYVGMNKYVKFCLLF